jgi:hypothetical protein
MNGSIDRETVAERIHKLRLLNPKVDAKFDLASLEHAILGRYGLDLSEYAQIYRERIATAIAAGEPSIVLPGILSILDSDVLPDL